MEAQIRTLEQGQQNLQRNKCSGHIHLHAFLGKLQIFQIFTITYSVITLNPNEHQKYSILIKTYTSEARKMGG